MRRKISAAAILTLIFAIAFLSVLAAPMAEAGGPPDCNCVVVDGNDEIPGLWDEEAEECVIRPCKQKVE